MLRTYVDEETRSLRPVEPGGDLGGQWEAYEDADGDRAYASRGRRPDGAGLRLGPEADLLTLAGR